MAEPTAGIIDAQSVRAAATVPASSRGYDGGKKVPGRKRHLVTDCLGLLLVVAVTAANIGDRDAAVGLLQRLRRLHRDLTLVWADGGYGVGVAVVECLLEGAGGLVCLVDDQPPVDDEEQSQRHGSSSAGGVLPGEEERPDVDDAGLAEAGGDVQVRPGAAVCGLRLLMPSRRLSV
ncbi:transposase [Streptomyces sp. NPDC001514]